MKLINTFVTVILILISRNASLHCFGCVKCFYVRKTLLKLPFKTLLWGQQTTLYKIIKSYEFNDMYCSGAYVYYNRRNT